MTAINCIRGLNAIYVLTDGASYDGDGVLQHIGQKVIVLPWLRAVIAARGPAEMFAAIGVHIQANMPTSFDELVECLPQAVLDIQSLVERSGTEVMLAGVSFGRNAFESYVMYTSEGSQYRGASGAIETAEPFTMIPLPTVVAAPSLDPAQQAEFGLQQVSPETFNPYVHGPAILQAQRRTKVQGQPYECAVGGFILLNTITQYGVNSEIIHSWPDKIGEVIAPAA